MLSWKIYENIYEYIIQNIWKTKYNVEEYLNNLPNDITEIDISNKELLFIPDLIRFNKLRKLNCSYNKLTRLPVLPSTLIELNCYINQLTSLPSLSQTLIKLNCSCNQLTKLPDLSQSLVELNCSCNQLTNLPQLPSTLKCLWCIYNQLIYLPLLPPSLREIHYCKNPIYDIVNGNNIAIIHNKNNIIIKFRELYYHQKFKKRFRDLLWIRIREPKIKQKYSPINLIKLINEIDDHDEHALTILLETW